MTELISMPPVTALAPAAATNDPTGPDSKLRQTAKQFEAVFMTEMLHFARPAPKASGVFAAGDGEKTWNLFMDQALGAAATAGGGTGLEPAIEKALRAGQGKRNTEE